MKLPIEMCHPDKNPIFLSPPHTAQHAVREPDQGGQQQDVPRPRQPQDSLPVRQQDQLRHTGGLRRADQPRVAQPRGQPLQLQLPHGQYNMCYVIVLSGSETLERSKEIL